MTEPKVIHTPTGQWVIDDGDGPLKKCPCCGKAFTERAAQTIVAKIERGELTMFDLRALQTAHELPD